MSMVPSPQQIGFNEMLIRMGAAGLAGSAEGGLQALGAIGDTFGKDANRATGLAAYQAQMEALGRHFRQAKQENMERVGQIDQTLFDMNSALSALEVGLTGFFDNTFKTWDNLVGNERAASRLLLEKLKVDDAMLRVARPKAQSRTRNGTLLGPRTEQLAGRRRLDRVDQTTPTGPARCTSPPCHWRTGVEPGIRHTSRPVHTAVR